MANSFLCSFEIRLGWVGMRAGDGIWIDYFINSDTKTEILATITSTLFQLLEIENGQEKTPRE
jgi:hypothetical protein